MKSIIALKSLVYAFVASSPIGLVQALTLDEKAKALEIIANTADRMCASFQAQGTNSKQLIEGSVDAELRLLLKKLASAGVRLAARTESTTYHGYLQQDLLTAASTRNECAQQYFDKLVDRLLSNDPILLRSEIRPNGSITERLMPDGRICSTVVDAGGGRFSCVEGKK